MPSWKCLCCGQVGCKPSTCPKGDPDAQKEDMMRSNSASRSSCVHSFSAKPELSVVCMAFVSPVDSSRSSMMLSASVTLKTMNFAWCLLTCLSLHPAIPICHPKCFRVFWEHNTNAHREKVIHLYQAQCRILPDLASDKGAVVDTGAQ